MDDFNENFASGVHVRSASRLFLQTKEQLQGLRQLVLLGQRVGLWNLFFDDRRAVDLHFDDLAGAFRDDLVNFAFPIALLFGRGFFRVGNWHDVDEKLICLLKLNSEVQVILCLDDDTAFLILGNVDIGVRLFAFFIDIGGK